eukprot:12370737-Heterocapsa_arctica.AAC.1
MVRDLHRGSACVPIKSLFRQIALLGFLSPEAGLGPLDELRMSFVINIGLRLAGAIGFPSFAFLGNGSKAYSGRRGKGSQPPARGSLRLGDLRFLHGGNEVDVQEPVGQRAFVGIPWIGLTPVPSAPAHLTLLVPVYRDGQRVTRRRSCAVGPRHSAERLG